MTSLVACPACTYRVGDDWLPLARRTINSPDTETHLCPECGLGRTIPNSCSFDQTKQPSLHQQYQSRARNGQLSYSLEEDEFGFPYPPAPSMLEKIREDRLDEIEILVQALQSASNEEEPLRLLQVGSEDGALLERAQHRFASDIVATGLEPCSRWHRDAIKRGVQSVNQTLEEWNDQGVEASRGHASYDLVLNFHVLEHLEDPLEHLKQLQRRLSINGFLLLEVPNLLGAAELLEDGFLNSHHRNVFSVSPLARLCVAAGLTPFRATANGPALRMLCRRARPQDQVPDLGAVPPVVIADAALANDLRLTLKRGLARVGPRPEMLEIGRRIYSRCQYGPGRADIAIELASACQKENQLGSAAYWLRQSLEDRSDSEVATMLLQIESILRTRPTHSVPETIEVPEDAAQPQSQATVQSVFSSNLGQAGLFDRSMQN